MCRIIFHLTIMCICSLMSSLSLDILHVFAWNVCQLSLSILSCDSCQTNRFYLVIQRSLWSLSWSPLNSKRIKWKSQLLTFRSFSTQYHTFSKPNSNQLLEHTDWSLKVFIDLLQKLIAQSFSRCIGNVT